MKITTALRGRIQQLLASLHPPSPPTAREGQQLLNVLQGSFQKQLDEKHPNPFRSRAALHDQHHVPVARDSASSHATTNYFASVLSHPLISTAAAPKLPGRDAVASLERLLATSKLNTATLIPLMTAYTRSRKTGDLKNTTDTLLLADRLHVWLQSTDPSIRDSFFLDRSCLNSATAMLLSEKNEAVLWKWLRMVYERDLINADLTDRRWLAVEDQLVSATIQLSLRRRDVQGAATHFVQACQYRIDSGRVLPRQSEPQSSMVLSAKPLASSIIYYRHNHGIPSDLFTKVLHNLLPWSYIPSGPEFSSAFCALYDPAKPTAHLLSHHLSNHDHAQLLVDRQARASPTSRKTIMRAILDASKLALEQGHRKQASRLINYAIDHYPDYLSPLETKEVEEQLDMSFHFAPG